MGRAQVGNPLQDIPFVVTVNGVETTAMILCEADDLAIDGTTIVVRYKSDTNDQGDWYSIFRIFHHYTHFRPDQKVRKSETYDSLGLHCQARWLLNTADWLTDG